MQRLILMACVLAVAGCRRPAEPSAPARQEAMVSNVVDVVTQRGAVDAGKRAADTIRRVSDQEKQDLKQADLP